MELAIATHIPCAAWVVEDDAMIATALAVLAEQTERMRHG